MITIFTPTYNRASFLPTIYQSLLAQTCKEFEWVIVDDGSSDDTEVIVRDLKATHSDTFPINYIYKPNGGKHTAINKGVATAKGELFWMLDSDDSLPADAVATVANAYKDMKDTPNLAGVCGLMKHHDGQLIGSGFPMDKFVANSIELRYRYHVIGDLMEVFCTKVLREFPFPEIAGERFCPEVLIWNRIAQKYSLYCINRPIYNRDYLEGGLTDRIVKIRMDSPVASMMCYSEMNRLPIPFVQKMRAAINYWRFRLCAKDSSNIPTISVFWTWVLPIAWMMHRKDVKLIKTK